jgi:bifunctional non-homologous end joining protein LigD
VRARREAPVATPLDWSELDDAGLGPRRYTITNLFRGLGQKPDPWADIDRHARPLRAAAERLTALGR